MRQTRARKISSENRYLDDGLITYMKQRLQLDKEEDERIAAGRDKSPEMITRGKELSDDKGEILDEVIFPAMANLLLFFRVIAQYPDLRSRFDRDIKELFGIIRNDPYNANYGHTFCNLVESMINVNLPDYPDEKRMPEFGYSKSYRAKNDFRVKLNHLLAQIVWLKFSGYLSIMFCNNKNAEAAIRSDFARVHGWTGMLDSAIGDEYPPLLIPKLERDSEGRARRESILEEQNKSIQSNLPHRTIDIESVMNEIETFLKEKREK
jgi:hypothetical protein